MEYRREVDGLRALAVLPVILFHAGFQSFSGGFVGVDVFFVISGYLITSIILAELEQGKFSILNFYERRARRILPALFLVMFACLPFAWLWLLPSDMRRFSQSLVAVSFFASNILFWITSGYFDTAAELKPLLHTWSLAVEEQYYVLFPMFLLLTWRLGKRWILALLSVLFFVSLAAAQWGAYTYPVFTFLLLPTRGWELLIGVFIAFYLAGKNKSVSIDQSINQSISLIGLLLIVYAVFAFNKNTPFPSLYALIPTVGAASIILFANSETLVGKLLGSRLFVGVGLISYSTYLWHQPLFAFARHRSPEEPSTLLLSALSVASVFLAYFSWKYVERPFRNRAQFNRKIIFISAAVGSFYFLALGLTGQILNGFSEYFFSKDRGSLVANNLLNKSREMSAVINIENRIDNNDCIFNIEKWTSPVVDRVNRCYKKYGQGIILAGDSHATNLFNSLNYINNNRTKFLVGVTTNGCNLPEIIESCQYNGILNFVTLYPYVFSTLVYEKAGWLMLLKDNTELTPDRLQRLPLADWDGGIQSNKQVIDGVVDYLRKIDSHVRVIWFGPRVEPQFGDREILLNGCSHKFVLRKGQYETYVALENEIALSLSAVDGIEYISQIKSYRFDFPRDFMSCDALYWIDGNHFSSAGEIEFGRRFDLLERILVNQISPN